MIEVICLTGKIKRCKCGHSKIHEPNGSCLIDCRIIKGNRCMPIERKTKKQKGGGRTI